MSGGGRDDGHQQPIWFEGRIQALDFQVGGESMVLWVASNNQAVHRMPKPPLRAGFVTDDGRRYALKEMPLRQHAFVQDSDNFNNTQGG